MNLHYLQATVADAADLADARVHFLTELLGPQDPDATARLRHAAAAYFEVEIPAGRYICWMAKVGSAIAGVGGLAVRRYPGNFKNPDGWGGYILNMHTHPDYRRRGIGSTILAHLQAVARERGLPVLELHATAQGEPLYRQEGFELHPEPTYRKWLEDRL